LWNPRKKKNPKKSKKIKRKNNSFMKTKNVVTIGGGTGSFVLLTGLKKYPINISAIVSMADNGGSTGILRDELGVLPPGDARQCLVALSETSVELRKLMNYRFAEGSLKGHSFGNLLLSALEKINGSFSRGIAEATKILKVKGDVVPVTEKSTNLFLELGNGKVLKGEDEINHSEEIEKRGVQRIFLSPKAVANPQALKKIAAADMIVIGPGNYYCSLVPIFLVPGIAEAIRKSKAKVIFNCNLVSKKGHTEKFVLDDYVATLNKLIGAERINYVVCNNKKPDTELIKKYAAQGEILVKKEKTVSSINYKLIYADVLDNKKTVFDKADKLARVRAFIRHDSDKLAKVLMKILRTR
jgi:uncharacterized cofD-like protein